VLLEPVDREDFLVLARLRSHPDAGDTTLASAPEPTVLGANHEYMRWPSVGWPGHKQVSWVDFEALVTFIFRVSLKELAHDAHGRSAVIEPCIMRETHWLALNVVQLVSDRANEPYAVNADLLVGGALEVRGAFPRGEDLRELLEGFRITLLPEEIAP